MNAYDPMKAAAVARAQGFTIAETASLYSTSALSNISAPSVEVLNQNGYSVYVDDNGNPYVKKDRDTNGGTIWTSDSLGMKFDYSGDVLCMTPIEDKSSNTTNGNNVVSNAADQYNNNFNTKGQEILNKLEASMKSNASYSDLGGLTVKETVDPYTGEVVDKEKSEAVDKLLNNESVKYKFDKLINLINKTGEARFTQEADYKLSDGVATAAKGTAAGAATGAAIGSFFGFPIGTAIGGAIGAVGGLIGGICTAVSDSNDTDKINEAAINESAEYAKELNSELEKLLQEGNEEEFIAFERYYQQQTGCSLSDVLKSLDVTDSNSAIAQASGFDSDYILDKLEKIDATNDYLDPEEVTETEETTETNGYNPEIDILKQKVNLYYQAWVNSLATGKVTVQGKEMTSDEIEKLYLETCEQYQNALSE